MRACFKPPHPFVAAKTAHWAVLLSAFRSASERLKMPAHFCAGAPPLFACAPLALRLAASEKAALLFVRVPCSLGSACISLRLAARETERFAPLPPLRKMRFASSAPPRVGGIACARPAARAEKSASLRGLILSPRRKRPRGFHNLNAVALRKETIMRFPCFVKGRDKRKRP